MKKTIKEEIRQLIRECISEIQSEEENIPTLRATFDYNSNNNDIKTRFARSISELLHLEGMFSDGKEASLSDIFSESDMDTIKDGDDFYAGPNESIRVFQHLPPTFKVVNDIDGEDETFIINKTGKNTFSFKKA